MLTFANIGYLVPPVIDNVSIKERKNKRLEKLHIQTFNVYFFIQTFLHMYQHFSGYTWVPALLNGLIKLLFKKWKKSLDTNSSF